MRIAVLDDYQGLSTQVAEFGRLAGRARIDVFRRNLSVEEAKTALRGHQVVCLMRERMAFPAELIDALPDLRMIAITGRRNRTLDLAAAARRGITVCHSTAAGASAWNTAELAWGLALAVARDIPAEDADLRAGGWQRGTGITLNGRVLGIVGLGRIGAQVAGYGRAFGMEVLAWSPNLTGERAAAAGATAVSREALFARSDVVSLHLVLGERSAGVVGAAEIGAMKPGAILVNTARAGLVDEAALVRALAAGRIRAGLDVFGEEPLAADSAWRRMPNCVLTPHLGYVTAETMTAFYRGTAQVVAAYLDGAPIRRIEPAA